MGFGGDVRRFNAKAGKALESVFRGTSLSLFSRIIRRTPVDTGRARGNWMAGLNSPSETGGEVGATVARARLGDSLFLTNNLPYIHRLEYGSSDQAPQGMLRITIAEYQQTVRKEARSA